MIGKILRHPDFAELSSYVLRGELKQPEVLAANGVRTSGAGEMAADFELQRSLRPRLRQALEHVALAWPPGEKDKLTDNEVMVRAAKLYMEERGIDPSTTQWVLVRHHDQEHPHCHLLLNRVTDDGQVLPDSQSHRKSAAACRKVEAAMGFVDAAQLGRAAKLKQAEQGELPPDVAERVQCKDLIHRALEKHLPTATTVQELREALTQEGVRMKATMQQGSQLQSVVFEVAAYPGMHVKGSEVAREYSGGGLRKTLEAQAEHREAAVVVVEVRPPAVPAAPESSAVLPSVPSASAMSPEHVLSTVPRLVASMPVKANVVTEIAPVEADKQLFPASIHLTASVPALVTDHTPVIPLQGQNVRLPAPVIDAVPSPVVVAAGSPEVSVPPMGSRGASSSIPDSSPPSLTVPAAPLVPITPVKDIVQPPQSVPGTRNQKAEIVLPEVPITAMPALQANAVGVAPSIMNEVVLQHGIIRMLTTDNNTSEARLGAVRAALVTAGAIVGEIVPPTEGRNLVPLLAYSFDPASSKLAEINEVLNDVQALYDKAGFPTSKVQEQQHPWHQPRGAVEANVLKWPEREGQFNQAQILVNESVTGQTRANRIAEDLRMAGASVGGITRGDQGVLTLQVHFHTCAPGTDAIARVLGRVTVSAGIAVQESQQNKDAHIGGMVLLATRQNEMDVDQEMGA